MMLFEFIAATPSMVENSRSSGVAMDDAMVSAPAPGRFAETRIVGKSTFGSWLTGRRRKARSPNARIASITSVVATGLYGRLGHDEGVPLERQPIDDVDELTRPQSVPVVREAGLHVDLPRRRIDRVFDEGELTGHRLDGSAARRRLHDEVPVLE